jgi:hypothetical protein
MAALHEIIAVDGDREKVAQVTMEEASTTFSKKHQLFNGSHRKLTMFDDKRKNEEQAAEEFKELTETVQGKLDYVWEHIINHLDCNAAKEATNCVAKADIVVNDVVLAKGIPATLLLSLESKLKKVREMYVTIPTLLPGIAWELDPELGDNIYKDANPEHANKTEKVLRFQVMVAATDKHPAQVEKWNPDDPVGVYETHKWTGMVSPADKSKFLGRIDMLIQSIKQARQRANEAKVVEMKVGKMLFDFIHEK